APCAHLSHLPPARARRCCGTHAPPHGGAAAVTARARVVAAPIDSPTPGGDPTVTRPTLPPFEEYVALLRDVWQRNHLTNAGPLVVELERQLAAYLGVRHCLFV